MTNQKSGFIEHLEELRIRIIWCVVTIVIASLISYSFVDKLICYLAKPIGKLVFIQPVEAFLAYIKLAIFCGLFVSFPVLLYHLLAFVTPGLKQNERKYVFLFIPFGVLLFVAGASFAYFVMLPFCMKFLTSFSTPWLEPMISIGSYMSFFCMVILIFGVVFELPVMILFLSNLGIVNPSMLRKNRKYVILVIFIVAAIFTPPDVFSQIIMAIPLWILFEISILLSCIWRRK
jgi:sec-independent protein translocase protein TatC